MNEPLVQRMLNLIYRNAGVRQKSKDALADWILDTQPRTCPLDPAALIDYLALQQPDLLARLKSNVHLQEELGGLLVSADPS